MSCAYDDVVDRLLTPDNSAMKTEVNKLHGGRWRLAREGERI